MSMKDWLEANAGNIAIVLGAMLIAPLVAKKDMNTTVYMTDAILLLACSCVALVMGSDRNKELLRLAGAFGYGVSFFALSIPFFK